MDNFTENNFDDSLIYGNIKEGLRKRLNRIEGQVRGIKKMVQENARCEDIINQISSINSALNSVRNLLLESHIEDCIEKTIEKKDTGLIKEMMKTLKRMMN